jgi:uncharacterized protein (DUF4415 family)
MPDLKKQTPRQRAQMSYMMDVMRRLEWDLHNTIEATGRIPAEWHEIAKATPKTETVKVTLTLEAGVVKFFKSMGAGYGPRINDVLKTYMHARLAGVIRGAETIRHYRTREGAYDGSKPQFGDFDREIDALKAELPKHEFGRVESQEFWQQRFAEGTVEDWDGAVPRVR